MSARQPILASASFKKAHMHYENKCSASVFKKKYCKLKLLNSLHY